MAKKVKQVQNVGMSETFDRSNEVPTEGIVNGKASKEISAAYNKVGMSLFQGKMPSKKDWSLLTEGMKNHYKDRYRKVNLFLLR